MVKILGAVMISCACGYFGLRISMTLKKRTASLADIITSLELLESEINFSVNRLQTAFTKADRNGLFKTASEGISEDGIKKAWERAVAEHSERLCLNDADIDVLMEIGKNLGKKDTDEEIKHIKYIKTLLKGRLDEAETNYNRLGKLYRNGGVLTGVMIAIMLI